MPNMDFTSVAPLKVNCFCQINDLGKPSKGVDDGQQIDAILLDFSKAFDKVHHMRLLEKLCYYGVIGPELKWIEGFLSNRGQQVIVSDQSSWTSPVTSGVLQGTVIGPLLFLVNINDLPECITSTACLFANDCLLYRIISTTTDAMALHQDLNNLQKWEDDLLMAFNPDKCEVLHMTNKRKITHTTYTIHGHQLKQVESARYLGVDFGSRLTFNRHIDCITKQANGAKAFLQCNTNRSELAAILHLCGLT